jgi:hypothetical protein
VKYFDTLIYDLDASSLLIITKEANEGVFKGEQRYGGKEIKGLVDCGVIEFLTQTACHKSQLIGPHTTYFPSLSLCT